MKAVTLVGVGCLWLLTTGCAVNSVTSRGPADEVASQTVITSEFGWGVKPRLPAPAPQTLPKVKPAKAMGWPQGRSPTPAGGFKVAPFAAGLDHPRWLHVLPNGDVLVAESDAPDKGVARGGIMGWIAKRVMRYAGSGLPSANRITLLRDVDGDGVADVKVPFIENLNSLFGMALHEDVLLVANTDAVLAFDYVEGSTRIDTPGRVVLALPAQAPNSHWTKNLLLDAQLNRLFVAVGSNSNIGELGAAQEVGRAAIWAVDLETFDAKIYARGLRNPVGMALHPKTGALWTVVNERDQLGDDLVPDYLAEVAQGDDYGWPTRYWGVLRDPRVPEDWSKALQTGRNPSVMTAPQAGARKPPIRIPAYALGAHTASLGLAFYTHGAAPALKDGAIIGQHGSWNREPKSGYQVIFVPFDKSGQPVGAPRLILTGFLDDKGRAMGRPVGVVVDQNGGILVADDVGGMVWLVASKWGAQDYD
jgi:glucose/arabinose dehydrogenase